MAGEIAITVRLRAVSNQHAVPIGEGSSVGSVGVTVAAITSVRQRDAEPIQIGHHHLRRTHSARPLERVAAAAGARTPPQSVRSQRHGAVPAQPGRREPGRQRVARQRALQRQLPPQLRQRYVRHHRRHATFVGNARLPSLLDRVRRILGRARQLSCLQQQQRQQRRPSADLPETGGCGVGALGRPVPARLLLLVGQRSQKAAQRYSSLNVQLINFFLFVCSFDFECIDFICCFSF